MVDKKTIISRLLGILFLLSLLCINYSSNESHIFWPENLYGAVVDFPNTSSLMLFNSVNVLL